MGIRTLIVVLLCTFAGGAWLLFPLGTSSQDESAGELEGSDGEGVENARSFEEMERTAEVPGDQRVVEAEQATREVAPGLDAIKSASWRLSAEVGYLAAFHDDSVDEILLNLLADYGEEYVERFQKMRLPEAGSFYDAQIEAAMRIGDSFCGPEAKQDERFLKEVLGMPIEDYLASLREEDGQKVLSPNAKLTIYNALSYYRDRHALFCNEFRSTVLARVMSGKVELQPHILLSSHRKSQIEGYGSSLIFMTSQLTSNYWAYGFALSAGDAPAFDIAFAEWKAAKSAAKDYIAAEASSWPIWME